MTQENFLSDYRDVILLEGYNSAKDAVLVWLQKRVQHKAKIEKQLEAAMEKGIDNSSFDKEIQRLQWVLNSEKEAIVVVMAMLEISENTLEVFRNKMLETLTMDVEKSAVFDNMKANARFFTDTLYEYMKADVDKIEKEYEREINT